MSHNPYEIIRQPIVTEKNMARVEDGNTYTFEVSARANKVEVRTAIESLFNVRVKSVRTQNHHGKRKRHGANWHVAGSHKKAIVTLHPDDRIDIV